jgi:ATP-dependent Clp protease ATP-binding subunit ClpC
MGRRVAVFERFTDCVRRVMNLAHEEARLLQHGYVGTEHILLAMVEEGTGAGVGVLKNLGVDIAKVRPEIHALIESGPARASSGPLPLTPWAKEIVEDAIDEMQAMKDLNVGTEHILLGLLRAEAAVPAEVLTKLGATLEAARMEIIKIRYCDGPR